MTTLQASAAAATRVSWAGHTELKLEGPNRKRRVVLFSGFLLSVDVWRDAATEIHRAHNATVHVHVLAGHNGSWSAMQNSRAWHYLDLAERQFLQFWEDGNRVPVVVGGFSVGALIAAIIAARHPDKIAGVAMVSLPLKAAKTHQRVLQWVVGILYYLLWPLAFWLRWCSLKKGFYPPRMYNSDNERMPQFRRNPFVAGATLLLLQQRAKKELPHLYCPFFLAHGQGDTTADYQFTMAAFNALLENPKRIRTVPLYPSDCPHRIPFSRYRDGFIEDISTWCGGLWTR